MYSSLTLSFSFPLSFSPFTRGELNENRLSLRGRDHSTPNHEPMNHDQANSIVRSMSVPVSQRNRSIRTRVSITLQPRGRVGRLHQHAPSQYQSREVLVVGAPEPHQIELVCQGD